MVTRVCIWGAWYESSNLGDQAILLSIASLLAQRLQEVELTVLSNRPAWTEAYLGALRLENLRVRAISQRFQFSRAVRALRHADLFLVGGGTPVYDDRFHLAALRLLVGVARMGPAKVMTYAISARRVRDPASRLIGRSALRSIPLLTVREAHSASLLHDLLGDPDRRIEVYTDPVVTFLPEEAAVPARLPQAVHAGLRRSSPLVAVCPHFFSASHSYRVHHYERFAPEAIERYYGALARLCDRLTERATPVLVPMNTESPDSDIAAILSILRKMAHADGAVAVLESLAPAELLSLLRRCELVVGTRLHSLVFASVAQVPMVALSYGPKVAGFMDSLGLQAHVHELAGLGSEDLWGTVCATWDRRKEIREHLSQRMPELRALAGANADRAVGFVSEIVR